MSGNITSNDLNGYLNKKVLVRLHGGREVIGTLKGHDSVVNLVLDDAWETIRKLEPLDDANLHQAPPAPSEGEEKKRFLGLIVAKGTAVVLVSPEDTLQEIQNPFILPQAAQEA